MSQNGGVDFVVRQARKPEISTFGRISIWVRFSECPELPFGWGVDWGKHKRGLGFCCLYQVCHVPAEATHASLRPQVMLTLEYNPGSHTPSS